MSKIEQELAMLKKQQQREADIIELLKERSYKRGLEIVELSIRARNLSKEMMDFKNEAILRQLERFEG